MFGEQIETLAPALAMSIAVGIRAEAGLFERDLGATAHVLEAHGDQRFEARLAALVIPDVGHHEALVRHDLAIGAAEPKLRTVVRAHAAAVLAAGTHFAFARRDRVAARRRPPGQMLLFGETAPHEVDR